MLHFRLMVITAVTLVLTAWAPAAAAFDTVLSADMPYFEFGMSMDPGVIEGELGVYMQDNPMVYAKAGIGFFSAEELDFDFYQGLVAGLGVQFPTRLTVFADINIFSGYATETTSAGDDWEDNDDDGWIDEEGEEDRRLKSFLLTGSIEIGIAFMPVEGVRLSLSRKTYPPLLEDGDSFSVYCLRFASVF